jgi:hypothetical protein
MTNQKEYPKLTMDQAIDLVIAGKNSGFQGEVQRAFIGTCKGQRKNTCNMSDSDRMKCLNIMK